MTSGAGRSDHRVRVGCTADAAVEKELSVTTRRQNSSANILIVEDERLVALDLASTLKEIGYSVVGSVSTGEAAIEQAIKLCPDLVLMDIRLAGELDGIQAALQIQEKADIPIIYLTAYSDDPTLTRAKATGPFGYLVKPFRAPELRCAIEIGLHRQEIESQLRQEQKKLLILKKDATEDVVAAVRRILDGEIYVSARIASQMLRPHVTGSGELRDSSLEDLSSRELEVFRLIGEGHATRQIAEKLRLSAKTVESYQAHIKKKLSLRSSRELIQRAIQWNLNEGS
jgi:DNA-binding NarL/FixJ family response regulator